MRKFVAITLTTVALTFVGFTSPVSAAVVPCNSIVRGCPPMFPR
jgi:hypothetical protein